MPSFTLERVIPAEREILFDLCLDIGMHVESQSAHGERVVGGPTSGVLGEGDRVTWSARHFGVRFRMSSIVFDVQPPHRFCDRQTKGPFGSFLHIHEFTSVGGGTLMRDIVEFRSPLGPLGRLVDATVMRRHLIGVITERNDAISARFS